MDIERANARYDVWQFRCLKDGVSVESGDAVELVVVELTRGICA